MNPFLAKQFKMDIEAEKREAQKQGKPTAKRQENTDSSALVTKLN